jgi:C1A family cysteine protease
VYHFVSMATRSEPKKPQAKPGFYGAVKDPRDHRDFRYSPEAAPKKLPTKVDLRPLCPRVHEQGHPLTCTAHSVAGAFQFEQRRLELKDFSPSRLFIFYNTLADMRARHVPKKEGANLRAALKAVAQHGVCPEKDWPFSLTKAAMAKKPNHRAYQLAEHHKITRYERMVMGQSSRAAFLRLMKCRLAEGFPFVFAFLVHESFESEHVAKTGIMPMPKRGEQLRGWHAVMAVGYDDRNQRMLVRNSWGWSWGIKGYFWMPYDYITNPRVTADFWTIRGVTPRTEADHS